MAWIHASQPCSTHSGRSARSVVCALQPAGGDGERFPAGVVEGEMQGDERSGPDVTFLDQSGVGAFPRFDALVEVAHPERGLGESFHIARLERTGVVGLPEEREALRPIAGVDRSAPAVDQLAHATSLRSATRTRYVDRLRQGGRT